MSRVYFITAREVGRVKIGHARDPQARFHTIQTHSPCELKLERVCEGGLPVEAALHQRFENARGHGEWFEITAEIEAFMAVLPAHEWRYRGWHHAARRSALIADKPSLGACA